MKRKGKKTFRGTAEQHHGEATHEAKHLRKRVNLVKAYLKRGHCASAYDALLATERSAAIVDTEAQYSMRSAARQRRGGWDSMSASMTMHKLRTNFQKKCLR